MTSPVSDPLARHTLIHVDVFRPFETMQVFVVKYPVDSIVVTEPSAVIVGRGLRSGKQWVCINRTGFIIKFNYLDIKNYISMDST